MSENIDINVGIIKEEISINAANNIVEVNISTAPVIIINPQDYDLSQFTNTSPNPFVQQSSLASYVPISRNITINGVTQNLITDRSWTISTGITIGTTAITSGTVGRVLFEGTGNVVQESANLFWDETNGRLGIGTSSPAHKLTVNADNNSTAVGIDFPSAHFDFSANSTSNYTASFHINNVGMDIGHDSTSRSLNLQTGNLDRVTILGNGNVGINTTTDAGFKLDVNGTARVQGNVEIGGASATTVSSTYNSTTRNQNRYTNNSSFEFHEGVNERMRIAAGGNVGIGTTSPGAKLEVADSIPVLRITGTRNASWTIGQTMASLEYFSEDTSGSAANSVRASINLVNETSVFGSTTGLSFSTKGDVVGSPIEAMRINSSGNVGIGTANPAEKLHVYGGVSAIKIDSTTNEASLKYDNSTTTAAIKLANNDLKTELGGSERMRILANGNLLINTTTDAGFKLDVSGTARVQGNVNVTGVIDTAQYINVGTQNSIFSENNIRFRSAGPAYLDHNTVSQSIKFRLSSASSIDVIPFEITPSYMASSVDMYFGDNDKLRLGASSDLQIYHDGSNSYINESGTWDLYVQTNGNNMFLRDSASGNVFIAMNTGSANVSLRQGGNTKLTTTSTGVSVTGNVGIGTSTPTTKINIVTPNNGDALRLEVPSTNITVYDFYLGNSINTTYIRANPSILEFRRQGQSSTIRTVGGVLNDLALQAGGGITFTTYDTNERMRIIGSTGNVLINTTTDTGYKLDVNGTSIYRESLTNTIGGFLHKSTSTSNDAFWSIVSGSVYFIVSAGGYCKTTSNLVTEATGVGTINASAISQIDSVTKGFLPPRMSNAQMLAIATPAEGLVVYDLTNKKLCCYDGTTWQPCW